MKARIVPIFWGIVLVLLGAGLLIATNLGKIEFDFDQISDWGWIIVSAVLSVLFFFSYFIAGVKNWGWLFPAFIFTAITITLVLAINDVEGSWMGFPILIAIAIPFYIGFVMDTKNIWLLFPAIILTGISLVTLVADSEIPDEWMGAVVLYSIGLPFLIVFLHDRKQRWALIPGGILAVIGTIPLVTLIFVDPGAAVMLLFSLVFFVIYFLWPKNWWAIIPGGVFASIGLVVVLSPYVTEPGYNEIQPVGSAILLMGFALTFFLLWIRRNVHPTGWAIYLAIGLVALALLTLFAGDNVMDYWPVVLLLVGGIIIVASLWPRRGGKGESQIASASAVAAPTPAESVPTPMETTPSPAESAPEIQPEEQAPGDTTV